MILPQDELDALYAVWTAQEDKNPSREALAKLKAKGLIRYQGEQPMLTTEGRETLTENGATGMGPGR